MKVVQVITDNREPSRRYQLTEPFFGAAPEALLEGFSLLPDIEVHVISCTQQPMTSPKKLADNIWFHSLRVPKPGWLRSAYAGCALAVRKKVKEIQPDIVHGQGTERDCAISAILSNFVSVVTIHGNMSALSLQFRSKPFSFGWLAGKLEHYSLPYANAVFCNSLYTQKLVQTRNRNTFFVPNALRLSILEHPIPEKGRTLSKKVINVGVVSPRKRQLEILHVLSSLHEAGLKIEVLFVGLADPKDVYARAFLDEVARLKDKGFVSHVQNLTVQELVSEYDSFDAMIHFPSEEAFGLVAAEALARGMKLFCSRIGGLIDIIATDPNVEHFHAEDWSGLRQSIYKWFSKSRPRSGELQLPALYRYHPKTIAEHHLSLYQRIMRASS